jgi:hypothetical protein
VPRSAHVVAPAPQGRHPAHEVSATLPEDAGRVALQPMRYLGRRKVGRCLHEQVYVVGTDSKVLNLDIKLGGFLPEKRIEFFSNLVNQHWKSVLRAPHEVIVEVTNAARCMPKLHNVSMPQMLGGNNVTNRKEVLRDFLCRLKPTVPVPHFLWL